MIKEKDIPGIKTGQQAKIFINALPYMRYKIFKGRIRRNSPSVRENEQFYRIYIDFNESEYNTILKKGMKAQCRIITERKKIIGIIYEKLFTRIKRV